MKKSKILFFAAAVILVMTVFAMITSAQQDVYYARDTIDGNVAYVYDKLCEDLLCSSPKTEINLDQDRKVTSDEVALAMELFLSDHPECFWVSGGYGYSTYSDGTVVSIAPNYAVEMSDIPRMRAQLESVVSSIIETVPGGDNYEKALYLHDVVASHVEYVHEGLHQTAYGALVSGKAVCAGYASAYQLLLQRVGICSWKISGQSYEPNTGIPEAHAWNMVMIEDDVCVYTDVTWDDQGDELYRMYFNNSLEEISETHFENSSVYKLPECNHNAYEYFDKNGAILNDNDEAQTLADMFNTVTATDASVVFKYTGENPGQWLTDNAGEVYKLLSGAGGYSYRISNLDREIHLTFTGSFESQREDTDSPNDTNIPDFEKNPDVEVPSENNPPQDPGENGGADDDIDASQGGSQKPGQPGASTPTGDGSALLLGCKLSAASGMLALIFAIAGAGIVFCKKK